MKEQTPSELFGQPKDDPKNMEQLAKEIILLSDDQFEANCNILMNVFYKSAPRGRGKIIQRGEKIGNNQFEWEQQLKFCKSLKKDYPDLLYRSDVQSAAKRTHYMRDIMAILDPVSGWPDTQILFPTTLYLGLWIEIKKVPKNQGESIYMIDGSFKKSDHIENQCRMHDVLRNLGYKVEFAEGAEKAMEIVKEYLR